MIIENQGQQYFVDDEIGNNQDLKVSEVFANAVPLEVHNLQVELEGLESIPKVLDENILNWGKEHMPEVQEETMNLQRIEELKELLSNY